MNSFKLIILSVLLVALAGCTIHPPGEKEERNAAMQAQKPFEKRSESQPPLAENATPEQLVTYALVSNAELQQRYWEWRSALEQVPQDGTQSTTLNVSLGTAITNGHTSWGASSVTLANDPMSDIKWPTKLDAAAKLSLENAKAAGRRFFKTRYELRGKVLAAYYDYALSAELIRLEQANEQLLEITANVTEARSRAGSSGQEDVLRAKNEVDMSRNDLANMQAQLPGQRAAINALLSRPAEAPLAVPADLPATRPVAYSDDELLLLAARENPELAALADEIHARHEGVRLAKMQYIPDFNLSAGTDLEGMTQSLLGQATVPILRYEAINAAIAQSEANLRAAEAMRRQTGNNLSAQVIADIASIRDAQRQLDLLEHTILPRLREVVNLGRSSYENGRGTLLDLMNEQRSLIAVQRLSANLTITLEKQLADLDAITTTDLSTPRGG